MTSSKTKKIKVPKVTVKRGRKKTLTPEKIQIAYALRAKGFTLAEIADALEVDESRLYAKGGDWEILRNQLNAIKAAQDEENTRRVENALLIRATGQTLKTTKETVNASGEKVKTTEKKEIPPDTRAIEYYLNNRAPERWKASPEPAAVTAGNDNTIQIQIIDKKKEE